MRIARVLTRLNLGGPARQVLGCDPILQARGHTLRLFAGRPEAGEGDLAPAARELGLDLVRVPGLRRGWRPLSDLRAARFLGRELRAFVPDVVHTHASKAGALGRRAALRRAPRAARVHTFHGHVLEGYFPPAVSAVIAALERRLAARTHRVVAVSHATADDLVRLGVAGEEQLVVIRPGLDLRPFLAIDGRDGGLRRLVGATEGTFLVGVVGRLAEVKRPELALDTLGMLADSHPHIQLVFVGDGEGRPGLERARSGLDRPLAERVHLIGRREEMAPVLADLDAVLLTSRSEGMPVSLIEAAAAALPVVATPVGGVPELVVEGRTGFLGEGAEELARGLARLADDPGEAREMGRRARTRARRDHGAEVLADRLEELYRAVCAQPREARDA